MPERRYTKNGEWVLFDGAVWKVGLTASSVEDLGDVNFVELAKVGRTVTAGEAVCTIEAIKAARDFYVPIGGRIAGVNTGLSAHPQLVNSSPEDEGWIFSLDSVSQTEVDALLNEAEWKNWETGR